MSAKRKAAKRKARGPAGPAAPEGLGEGALRIWEAERERLEQPLSDYELEVFGAYCWAKARWLACDAYLEEHGPAIQVRSDRGELKDVKPAPEVAIGERAERRMIELAGLLPFKGQGRSSQE